MYADLSGSILPFLLPRKWQDPACGKEQRAKGKGQRASAGKAPLLIPRDDGVEWISLLERAFKHARPSQLQNQYRVRKGGLPALLVSSQSTPVKEKNLPMRCSKCTSIHQRQLNPST